MGTKYWNEFAELYSEAAVRIVAQTPIKDLKGLSFYPFALYHINENYPEQVKLINKQTPDVRKFRKELADWLVLKAKSEPKDSMMKAHLESVLQYVKNLP